MFPSDLAEGVRILRLLLSEPQLDPKAFERLRDARLARVAAEDTRLRGVTSRLTRRLLWGDVPETRRPTQESLSSITLADVRAHLQAVTGPERIVLSVSGDLAADALVARLDDALGDWKRADGTAYEPPHGKNDRTAAATGVHLRAMPVSQGSVRIGQVTVPREHADAKALNLLASILSRRIFNTVRSVHGLSYQAGARFSPSWRNDSPFTITFQTKCASVPFAVHLALEEVQKLIEDGPTTEEVADAKRSLDSSFRRTFGRGFDAAEAFAELEAHGVDLGYYEALRRGYAEVTVETLQNAAARYLQPEQLLVLCVGDVETMKRGDGTHPMQLSDLGPITVHAAPAADAPYSAETTSESHRKIPRKTC